MLFFIVICSFSIFVLLIGITLFLYRYLVVQPLNSKILMIAIFIIATGFGILRFDVADMGAEATILDNFVGNKITVEAVIIGEPEVREFNTRITVKLKKIFSVETNKWKEIKTNAIITTEQYPERNYGDELLVSGVVKKPKNFSNSKKNKNSTNCGFHKLFSQLFIIF